MRITHVVCTSNLAGVERHVAVLAAAQHDRGHEVTVLGGDTDRMRVAINRPEVRIFPAPDVAAAARQLAGPAGRRADIVATNMTAADLAALTSPVLVRTPVVSTRHFAARRGSRPQVRTVTDRIEHRLAAEIAVSEFIAGSIDSASTVILPGIPDRPDVLPPSQRDRTVLVAQRLEPEKSTDVALSAFAESGLATQGWRLVVAGDGSLRAELESLAGRLGISHVTEFVGHRDDLDERMTRASVLVAPCPIEGLGLTVIEAMAAELPVVAAAAGGHLESLGGLADAALFPAGDAVAAGRMLKALATDPPRLDVYGRALRERQREAFSVTVQAEATDALYEHLVAARAPLPSPRRTPGRDLVIISLEPWDQVWRRNQHLVTGLLRQDPQLRALFVEPVRDPLHAMRTGGSPRSGRGLRRGPYLPGVGPDGLWLLEPTKFLPRRVDPHQDERWARKVHETAERLGFVRPTLWVNDPTGAHVLNRTGWPTLYDITDDWLVANRDDRTRDRLVRDEEMLMRSAEEVVVCSPGLLASKSAQRSVTLLRNAVDVDRYRRLRPRPEDLPEGAVAVYVGTLHSDRLDVPLVTRTANHLAGTATVVLVGPNALDPDENAMLSEAGVVLLGGKDHREVPGYLQYADVLLVPHVVDDFTESLDPIKLYEYQAVGRPVVSTPVSGFREAGGERVRIVSAAGFPAAVRDAVPAPDHFPTGGDAEVPTWADRVAEMWAVIERVRDDGAAGHTAGDVVPLTVRTRLGHAAVQYVADRHHVDVLHIKGDALASSLVHPGRTATDADVLVRPKHIPVLLRALESEGFVRKGRFETSSPFEHSTTYFHFLWGHIDVHRLFPGLGLPPQEAFERLWDERGETSIAGRPCPVPAVPVQALLLVLHAARNPPNAQPGRDVEHVWTHADPDSQRAITEAVDLLDAHIAFAVGTGTTDTLPRSPERDLWQAVSHLDGRLHEWRARIAAAPDLATRTRLLARLPLVNTDHLATRLGRRPNRREVAAEFLDRARRAVAEYRERR